MRRVCEISDGGTAHALFTPDDCDDAMVQLFGYARDADTFFLTTWIESSRRTPRRKFCAIQGTSLFGSADLSALPPTIGTMAFRRSASV